MYVLNGKRLNLDVPFTAGDVTYPANWLRLSTPEQREALEITERPDIIEPYYDRRFYWGVDNPKVLEDTAVLDSEGNETGETQTGLKTLWVNRQKDTAANLLLLTDWYVTRKCETGQAVPDEITTKRSAIRAACEQREGEINGCTTTAELAALINENRLTNWP
jgi:hypothetical protein|tara:strand:- start:37 stop:525 length:489 start_codon:yes stop_codon:yes gene_type:complete